MTIRLTAAARRYRARDLHDLDQVATRRQLELRGITSAQIAAQVAAGRWQLTGTAVVLHNAALTRRQYERAVMINCGPRAVLTAFTGAGAWGLRGWERPDVHVLAPGGTTRPNLPHMVLHRARDWSQVSVARGPRLHQLPQALVLGAASFEQPRPACGLLAAAVQQRLTGPHELREALRSAVRTRHRRSLLLAVDDIEQGAQALSEIDLRRLCSRYGLPPPTHQAVRKEPDGRRRYLDAEWRLAGRRLAVEVDGALHLAPLRWYDDALRQNEIVIGGTPVLRFPSVLVRDEQNRVADQIRRGLGLT